MAVQTGDSSLSGNHGDNGTDRRTVQLLPGTGMGFMAVSWLLQNSAHVTWGDGKVRRVIALCHTEREFISSGQKWWCSLTSVENEEERSLLGGALKGNLMRDCSTVTF